MFNYTFIQWLFIFYFYCFAGWIVETSYVSLRKRKFINRGFMRGPFLPLYGSGAVMMLLVSRPFFDNKWLVFIAGCVASTILEYVTGVTMESLFKVRYWDYSDKKIQFQGHICLGTTLSWGVLTLFMTEFLHIKMEKYILSHIHNEVLVISTFILTAVVFADFAIAFKNALDFKDVMDKLVLAKKEFANVQARLDAIVSFAEERKDGIVSFAGERKENIAQLGSDIVDGLRKYRSESESRVRYLTSQIRKKARSLREANPSFHYSGIYKEAFKDMMDEDPEDEIANEIYNEIFEYKEGE